MKKFIFIIFITLFHFESFSQSVENPLGPNLIDWQNDHVRMKKAKVAQARAYVYENGKQIMKQLYDFDTMGYIIKEVEMRNGKTHFFETLEWGPNYHSNQIYRQDGDKIFCFRKEEFDSHGHTTATYYGTNDGSFELQGSYVYNYNPDGLVDHVKGNWYDQKRESFYTYDAKGRMTKARELTQNNPDWNWEYSYDSLGRLIKEYWWEKEGKDTSMVGISHWTWNPDGTIQKEVGKGRGWNDINYEWKGDTLKIDFSRGAEFGPSYKYKMQLSSDKKLVNYMLQTSPRGWKEEELWYEYSFY